MARIYDRPDLDQVASGKPLYVTGALPPAQALDPYEGRLQIHNAIGTCAARQVGGDELPPGTRIYVDDQAHEVVIAWPGYVEKAAPIPNAGFEDGITGWSPGAGWSVTTNNAIAANRSAVYQRNGGASVISSVARYPVIPGAAIHAQCQVRQGASSAGNAGAAVRLEFRDADGEIVATADGNYVMSASKNAVYPSNVMALPPAGAATVNVAGVGVRHRENKDVWIDSFSWDHEIASVGLARPRAFALTIEVRDSAGRVAYWTGAIGEYLIYLTSRLYPIDAPEEQIALSPTIVGFVHRNQIVPAESEDLFKFGPSITGFVHRGEAIGYPVERMVLGPSITGFLHRGQPTGRPDDPFNLRPSITGFIHQTHPSVSPAERALLSPTITGFVHA